MIDFDASTPQLKAVKRMIGAYISLDLNNLAPLLSKDYQYEAFPKSADFPIQTKESHLQVWGKIFSPVNKLEVIYHDVVEAPGKVFVHISCVFFTVFGAALNYDMHIIYNLVEEDGELKILRCKDFADPKQRDALFAGTFKAAAERVAA